VAYDGTSIWITNLFANTVSKMNPVNGTRVDYATGDSPQGVAFDGTNIWITNYLSDTVSKLIPG
jgi:DNA-binding beta-propeller fold protein YncE